MTKPQIKEYDCETGIEITRNATEAEIAQMATDVANELLRKSEAEAKAQIKAAAEAKLVALGLSLDDLKALGL